MCPTMTTVVVRQVRGRTLTAVGLLRPVPIVVWAGTPYLHGVSTQGNNLALIGAGLTAGLMLGTLCATLTTVTPRPDGTVFAKATGGAAALWILGMGSRLACGVYATHGGGPAIARFGADHRITGGGTWTPALLLMSLGEVLVRAGFLGIRAHRSHDGGS